MPQFDAIEQLVRETQDAFMGLRHRRRPVVTAPLTWPWVAGPR
jgi:hypothetical protein